jgi:ketosteroid isomerase-like protein
MRPPSVSGGAGSRTGSVIQIDVEEMKDGADSVVACVHLTGRGVRSGLEVDLRIYMHFKLRDGKIVYIYEYATEAQALKAAGLRVDLS